MTGPRRAPLFGLLSGVMATQLVNSALHLVQPLLIAHLSGSLSSAAFFSAFDTALHTFGTFCGGWPVDRYGARRVLIVSTFMRAMALAAVPVAMLFGFMDLTWAMIWYSLDAWVRGFVDASVHTVPLELGEHRANELNRINSRYEFMFDLGGAVGPLALGGLMIFWRPLIPHILIPIGFVIAAFLYTSIPEGKKVVRERQSSPSGTLSAIYLIIDDKKLLITCGLLALFNVYPLRKLLSAFFAKAVIGQASVAGFVGAAIALGGVFGALFFGRIRASTRTWIIAGSIGMVVLATGWLPAQLVIMITAVFIFAFTNVGARLALTRVRQELTPLEHSGGVTAASQFAANFVSILLKAGVGAAFMLGYSAFWSFGVIGIGLLLIAAAQMFLARRLRE